MHQLMYRLHGQQYKIKINNQLTLQGLRTAISRYQKYRFHPRVKLLPQNEQKA